MPNNPFLVCLVHPFVEDPYIFIKKDNQCFVRRNCNCLDLEDTYVAYDFSCLIDKLRHKKIMSLPKIVDIQTAKKLVVGKKKSEYTPGNQPWILKNIIGKHVDKDVLKWLSDFIKLKISPEQIDFDLNDKAVGILNGIEKSWEEIENNMQKTGNSSRFWDIENKLYNYFIETQFKGINVPHTALISMVHDLYEMHYINVKKLELKHGYVFNPIGISAKINFSDIRDFIKGDDIVKEDFDYNFWDSVSLYSECDEFLMALHGAYNAMRDRNALLRYMIDQNDSIFPKFDIMGTVTGRILITSPGIQYLKKTSRSIFKPRPGAIHLYADFDQFEPGIIASFSKDQSLMELYNKGDVYKELSNVLFKTTPKRKIAKIIFLAFMYGMKKDKMGHLVENLGGKETGEQGMRFFDRFETLCGWKEKACEVAKNAGYASSYEGNQRYLSKKNNITVSEKRWVPNQIIQGTASYIFKKALVSLKGKVPDIDLLVPMHDAILLEVQRDQEEKIKSIVRKVFVEEFIRVCPDINASISFERFHE